MFCQSLFENNPWEKEEKRVQNCPWDSTLLKGTNMRFKAGQLIFSFKYKRTR